MLELMPGSRCGALKEEKATPRSEHPRMRMMRAAIETVPLVAGHLDQIAAAEGSHQRCRFVHQGAKVGSFDLPALGQLADHELGIGVDEEAVG